MPVLFAVMFDDTKAPLSANDLLQDPSLHRQFQAEPTEILKHERIESEKIGWEIEFERALTDWIIKHRSKWRDTRLAELHLNRISTP